MPVTRWLIVLLVLASCAVRRPVPRVETSPQLGASALPEGVAVSRDRGYLVKASPATLVPGEENTITFSVIDEDFDAVDLAKMKIDVTYIMPSMPQMGVFKAVPTNLAENEFEATLDIVHGGDWRLTLSLQAEGEATADQVIFEYDVK